MEAKAKLAGHALHSILIVFPLGLLCTSVIFDIIYLIGKSPRIADAAYFMIAAGILSGLVAAAFGFIDWLSIPPNTRAKAIGLWHAVANVIVLSLFAISWYLRYRGETTAPSITAIGISIAAFLLAGVAGWLGGELVERLGIGVHDGAHLNAPNSLSSRPASDHDTNYEPDAGRRAAPIGTIPGREAAGRAPQPGTRPDTLPAGVGRPTPVDVGKKANVD